MQQGKRLGSTLTRVVLPVGIFIAALVVGRVFTTSANQGLIRHVRRPVPNLPVPLRGVRMQAASCSDASGCGQQLDCLQAAGFNVVYYTVIADNQAYYSSALMRSQSFDSLAYLVPEAHKRGMQVYALMTVAALGWNDHPEWNARLNHPAWKDDWLDFSVPEARSYVAGLAKEIVTKYEVDGILLDYIRYNTGFEQAGLNANDVSLTVQGIYDAAKSVRPVTVAASVLPSGDSGRWVGELWYQWLDGGYIDYVTPFDYVDDNELRTLLQEYKVSGYFPEQIIPRLSVALFGPARPRPMQDTLRQMQIVDQAGAIGVSLWDDRFICSDPNLVKTLGATFAAHRGAGASH